jgi:rhamnose transport system ATP-binding protein
MLPTDTATTEPILEMVGISKAFPGVKALEDVSLTLRAGHVTALIGENGAGKSTLVKILTGIYQADSGVVRIDGKEVSLPTAEAAQELGITAIHQETVLFDELTVAENIYIGHAPRNRWGLIDWPALHARAAAILHSIDAPISTRTRLKDLSIAQRHLVAIARALSIDARIVIMDEPTAALSYKEVEELFEIVDRLKKAGKAILFISHKFEEVWQICEFFAVFRDGRQVGAGRLDEVSHHDLVKMMVGRELTQTFPKLPAEIGDVLLTVDGYCHPTEFDRVSFELRRGEILGLYGLVGAGRSEFCQALFGITRPSAGSLRLGARAIAIHSPSDAINAGIVYVPEERGRHGTITAMSIVANISLPSLRVTSRRDFLRMAEEFALARRYAEQLDLRATSLSQPVGTLSGGNQQKVVIGKWLATRPKVIILDEPTKGIDIGSKAAVHAFMSQLAVEGLAVIMVSSEIPEVLGMSDRVIVMREGRMAGVYDRAGLTPETLVRAATGNPEAAA